MRYRISCCEGIKGMEIGGRLFAKYDVGKAKSIAYGN